MHILIIPKDHDKNFQDVEPAVMASMTAFIQDTASLLGLDKSGYRLITNNGEDGGQEVMHLHFHLVGGTKLHWGHVSDASPYTNI